MRVPSKINVRLIDVATTALLIVVNVRVAVGQFEGASTGEVASAPNSMGATIAATPSSAADSSKSSNGWGGDGLAGNGKNVENATFFYNDFGDLRTIAIATDEKSTGQIISSPAIDLVQIFWLGEDVAIAGYPETTLGLPSGAPAVKAWYWSQLGMVRRSEMSVGIVSSSDAGPPTTLARNTFGTHNNGIGIVYGMRTLRLEDDYRIDIFGSIMGRSYIDTTAESRIAGPEMGLVLAESRGPWTIKLQGTVVAGVTAARVQQQAGLGEEFIPGALNRSLYARPSYVRNTDVVQEFSPSEEFRAESNLRIAKGVLFKLAWSSTVIDDVPMASDRNVYLLPNLGLRDPGGQRVFNNNLFCGVEYVR